MQKEDIIKAQNQYVVKANDLIRKTRFDLTSQQQKIVLFAISKIKPTDDHTTEYTFDLKEFCNACGMNIVDGGTYITDLKADLEKLTERKWCTMPNGDMMTMSWIGDVKIPNTGTIIKLRFNPNMQPYLFDLKEKYTQYKLESILAFKGKYAIRLYELLRSYTTQASIDNFKESIVEFSLDYLKKFLETENYKYWTDFERFVLKVAIKEINRIAEDISIEYQKILTGNKVTSIRFIISTARVKQSMNARIEKNKRLKRTAKEAK